jgi:hypothetical protein
MRFQWIRDVPWCAAYRYLDSAFPRSRFVLTVRDEERWISSTLRHISPDHRETSGGERFREWFFGAAYPQGNEEKYLAKYRSHNREVREYFADSDSLLVCDWEQGDGWEHLCRFLNLPNPAEPFPHANRGELYSR